MAARVLRGLQAARVVFHTTDVVRDELLRHRIVPEDRLVKAPYGVSDAFTPGAPATLPTYPYLLHVGSSIPRKRVDVLLDAFAVVRIRRPELRLIHAGADFTRDQYRQVDALGLRDAITSMMAVTRAELVDLYRGASLVLLPSDAEGFGLPVIEALACGASVVASDIPVLREVGADAVTYCAVGNIEAWANVIDDLLERPESRPSVALMTARAARFRWSAQASTIVEAYRERLELTE